ncbi:MAG: hypothetical protein ACM3ZF_08335 [Mycobacterium leprae]
MDEHPSERKLAYLPGDDDRRLLTMEVGEFDRLTIVAVPDQAC